MLFKIMQCLGALYSVYIEMVLIDIGVVFTVLNKIKISIKKWILISILLI